MSRETPLPLDLGADQFTALLDELTPRLAHFIASLASQPAYGTAPTSLDSWRHEPPPMHGTGFREICDRLLRDVVPHSFNTAAPGYLAYVPGGGLLAAGLADLIACVVNRYVGVYAAAPAAVELEMQALRWLAELLGLPATTGGVTTTGGSMSAWLAAVAARERCVPNAIERATAYVSGEAHHSVERALRLAGVKSAHVRRVSVDASCRLRVDVLEQLVSEDRARGLAPFFVCGTAGTVNSGAIDPLPELAAFARREQLWFHVDGAYGGVFAMLPELRARLQGFELGDSIVVDPHKGLFLPYGTGVLFVRNLDDLQRAFASHAAYLPPRPEDDRQINYCDHTPELSRDWRGLRIWLPLALHGAEAFRAALREKCSLARELCDFVAREPGVEIVAPPELSLFAFRRRFVGLARADENARNRDLLARINASQRVMLTGTEIGSVFYLRACVLHLRTHADRIGEVKEILGREFARA
ncbi:MAG: pyridoxal phosphate-dependent decarboxylase family protein [Planctomycetota bacterium]